MPDRRGRDRAAKVSFEVCAQRLLINEGGYKPATPEDPGGETNYGIAARYHPGVDIKNLTPDGAVAIYKAEYWPAVRGGELPQAIAWQLLDFSVHSGPGPAIKGLQDALRVTRDGVLGPKTIAAATGAAGPALVAW